MEKLILKVKELKRGKVGKLVEQRMSEFERLGQKTSKDIFKELCFCTLTANFNAERTMKIQNEINDGFLYFSEDKLAEKLKELGYRYPNKRAQFIVHNRKYKDDIKERLQSLEEHDARDWIAENAKGIGYKEASHFLRNIGFRNFAIIDFHIVDILAENELVEKPKTITKKNYLEIENILKKIAEKTNTRQGELDMYLWYLETGKVLK